ncbi:MAG TPA: hypothetical protein VKV04_16150 [Verrucomicrobiae bacterium]|nr:hypothetical protein [Verrucomicrobiae bacterium]
MRLPSTRNLLSTSIAVFMAMFCMVSLAQTNEQRQLILVVGAPGDPDYAEQFSTQADLWKQAATKGSMQITVIGQSDSGTNDDRTILLNTLTTEVSKPSGELWLVFIGHGTFDGHSAKFNLRGPDIAADELATALKPCRRPLIVIQCASASGPFLSALSVPGRVIITATRSGYEVNATHFGGYLARAIADPAADLDKDGQTSLLEAFLLASRQTADFYKEQGRLMTEHALLDDNGDKLGTPPDWFQGVRAVKTASGGKSVDGVRAHQIMLVRSDAEQKLSPELRARRDALEQKLSALRSRKAHMAEDDYYQQLESILVETARLYQSMVTK